MIAVSVLTGSVVFFVRVARVGLFKTISSCFSIGLSRSFLPRRLDRIATGCDGCGSMTSGVVLGSTVDMFFDFVLRPTRRLGDDG